MAEGLYRRADHIVSVTESFVDVLRDRGVPAERMSVVRNGVRFADFGTGARDDLRRVELGFGPYEFVATYLGTLGMAHALSSVLDTAELTRGEPVRYLFVGDGAEKSRLVEEAASRGLTNVTFLDRQPRERVPVILAASDAVLVHLKDDPLFDTVIPSKIFESMGPPRPKGLAVSWGGAEIVTSAGAGLIAAPESPEELARALRRLRENPELAYELGMNGRAAAENEFCRRSAARRMLEVLAEVAAVEVERPSPSTPGSREAVQEERPSVSSRELPSRSSVVARP